jgi:beta-glucosidase
MFVFLSGWDCGFLKNNVMTESCLMRTKLIATFIIFFIALLTITCKKSTTNPDSNGDDSDPIYKNPNYSVEERVDDLLSRMTLDEKIGQMTQAERQALGSENDIRSYFLGSLLSGGGSAPSPNTPSEWADMYDRFQTAALNTRLGIPIIYGIDAVHGHNNVYGATIFPHNIGMGCTRNPTLVEQAARATAEEVAGTGIDWTFAPCIAVPQDERWGRTYEGFGETPELAEQIG